MSGKYQKVQAAFGMFLIAGVSTIWLPLIIGYFVALLIYPTFLKFFLSTLGVGFICMLMGCWFVSRPLPTKGRYHG